jgi:hypothetical protein
MSPLRKGPSGPVANQAIGNAILEFAEFYTNTSIEGTNFLLTPLNYNFTIAAGEDPMIVQFSYEVAASQAEDSSAYSAGVSVTPVYNGVPGDVRNWVGLFKSNYEVSLLPSADIICEGFWQILPPVTGVANITIRGSVDGNAGAVVVFGRSLFVRSQGPALIV